MFPNCILLSRCMQFQIGKCMTCLQLVFIRLRCFSTCSDMLSSDMFSSESNLQKSNIRFRMTSNKWVILTRSVQGSGPEVFCRQLSVFDASVTYPKKVLNGSKVKDKEIIVDDVDVGFVGVWALFASSSRKSMTRVSNGTGAICS